MAKERKNEQELNFKGYPIIRMITKEGQLYFSFRDILNALNPNFVSKSHKSATDYGMQKHCILVENSKKRLAYYISSKGIEEFFKLPQVKALGARSEVLNLNLLKIINPVRTRKKVVRPKKRIKKTWWQRFKEFFGVS